MTTLPDMRLQIATRDWAYDQSGTITTGGTAQLVIPERKTTTMLLLQNVSSTATMFFTVGTALLSCTISGGSVNAVTVVNAGFGFTNTPTITPMGGGNPLSVSGLIPPGLPGWDTPANPGTFTAVMTSAAPLPGLKISSVTIGAGGGSGYLAAPYLFVTNAATDPSGVATPTANGAGTYALLPYGSLCINDFTNPTDPIAVYCPTTGAPWTLKWRP